MKKQLNEVKRLQKLAAIISENSMGNDPEQQIAQNIYDDLLGERDAMELAGMTTEEALETIEAMGIPQRIAKHLVTLAGGLEEVVKEYGRSGGGTMSKSEASPALKKYLDSLESKGINRNDYRIDPTFGREVNIVFSSDKKKLITPEIKGEIEKLGGKVN